MYVSKNHGHIITAAAVEHIPKSKGRVKRKSVPWWDDKCKIAVRQRKKAFKLLKKTHNFQHTV